MRDGLYAAAHTGRGEAKTGMQLTRAMVLSRNESQRLTGLRASRRLQEEIVSMSVQRARKAKQIISDQEPVDDPAKYIRRLGYPDNSTPEKIDLARCLSRCGKGDRRTILAVVTLLNDPDHQVRTSALDSLERLIPAHKAFDFDGRKEVIQALGHMCTDFNMHSREKALQLLVSVARKSDPDVLASVMNEIFKESDQLPLYARMAAVHAVPSVVKVGDPFAIRPLISELDDENPLVRHKTIAALRKITPRESVDVIQALLAHLSDDDANVRFIAIETLVEIGCKGHKVIINALCDKLSKRRLSVSRLPMLKALVALSEQGHQKTILCLLKMVNDDDVNVRLFASESLGIRAEPGHFETYSTLMAKLNQTKTRELLRIAPDNAAESKTQMDETKAKMRAMHNKKRWSLSAVDFAEELHGSGNSSAITSAMPSALASAIPSAARALEKDSSEPPIGDMPVPALLTQLTEAIEAEHEAAECSVTGALDAPSSGGSFEASSLVAAEEDASRDEETGQGQDVGTDEPRDADASVFTKSATRSLSASRGDSKKELDEALETRSSGRSVMDVMEITGEEPAGLTTMPLTPPYTPKTLVGLWHTPEAQDGCHDIKGHMELDMFQINLPPLQLPSMSPDPSPGRQCQTARASTSDGRSGTFRRSFISRNGSQTHRRYQPLPLSTPSQQSLSISAARRRVWLTPPNSRLHEVWGLHDSIRSPSRGRVSVATDHSSSAATPAPASPLLVPTGRTGSASSIKTTAMASPAREPAIGRTTSSMLGRTESSGTRASFISRTGSSTAAGPRSLERRRSSAGRRLSVRIANMEPDAKVRQAVIKSLQSVATPGNLDVLDVVAERLLDPDLQVRRQTVQALTVLIAPVVSGPTGEIEEAAGDDAGKRISDVMASFRSILLQMIEDRSSKFRTAALEGLKVIAKPGDFTALNLLVKNIHQLNHFEVVQLLKRIATPNTYQVVKDCIFFCLRKHDEKVCEDHKVSQAQLRFYVDFIKSATTHGHRDTVLQLVSITKEVHISQAAKQACIIAVHGLVSRKDREIVFSTIVGTKAVRDLEIEFREPRQRLGSMSSSLRRSAD